ncbi:hypothetical protein [Gemmiger sp.]|uniref:hypothetical protein n=1 Tax=Gemmiger sp. TaxID=2049027 RepID=UPI002A828448|nr:hypothetical protein [Gemmiger sp.]MDY4447599.1 hypothetical protein [Gemmiger sp.]
MAALIIAIFPQNSSRGNWEEQQDRTDPNSRFELARKPVWLLAFRQFGLPKWKHDFESGITWICPYFSLFCFALHRLFSSFTLVFDTSNYIVLNVARGCLGNIWATLIFWATLFGAKQENSKNYTKIEDLAIFQSKSFFFFRRIFR